jgi:hypothetical protein
MLGERRKRDVRQTKRVCVKMKMDKEREAREKKKKQGEAKSTPHSQNQNFVRGCDAGRKNIN